MMNKVLRARMRRLHIVSENPSEHTVLLRDVPVNEQFFNKRISNILLKREDGNHPYLLFVDEDLEYIGRDLMFIHVFSESACNRRWKCLNTAIQGDISVEAAIERVFLFLGTENEEPSLSGFVNIHNTRQDRNSDDINLWSLYHIPESTFKGQKKTLSRDEYITEGASCFLRTDQTRLLLIVGPPGVGKTNLVHGISTRLIEHEPSLIFVQLNTALLLSGTQSPGEREKLLKGILDELVKHPEKIVIFEHFDLLLRETTCGALLLANALDAGGRLGGTLVPSPDVSVLPGILERRTQVLTLDEASFDETVHILLGHLDSITREYDLIIDQNMAEAATAASSTLPGYYPAKALSLLHAAASRAALVGSSVVGLDDIYHATARHTVFPAQPELD